VTEAPTRAGTSAAASGLSEHLAVWRTVADPVRARILALLAREELCGCHLQDELGMKQTLVSHHLGTLRRAGLVEAEPHGRFVYYRLRPGALDAAGAALTDLAAAARRAPVRRSC
jgi:ArsR family transcriptional regulator